MVNIVLIFGAGGREYSMTARRASSPETQEKSPGQQGDFDLFGG
jgi:hypothetical protein